MYFQIICHVSVNLLSVKLLLNYYLKHAWTKKSSFLKMILYLSYFELFIF